MITYRFISCSAAQQFKDVMLVATILRAKGYLVDTDTTAGTISFDSSYAIPLLRSIIKSRPLRAVLVPTDHALVNLARSESEWDSVPRWYALTQTGASRHYLPDTPWYLVVRDPAPNAELARQVALAHIGDGDGDSYLQEELDHLQIVSYSDLTRYHIDLEHLRNAQVRSWYVVE